MWGDAIEIEFPGILTPAQAQAQAHALLAAAKRAKSQGMAAYCATRQAGNSSATAFAHYLVLPEEGAADEFFGVMPPNPV